MSLTKKDPSMRVAANDPHLVSLGGGRLSTAVTIHNIPIGDTTIGSSPACNISLNGSGVRATHCTIYRSEENEVTIVPETDARILIDGTKILQDTNLTQGAMITIGNSNYLRFNNPAEAQMIRSVMGSNERISMPQIDFTQVNQRNSLKSNLSSSTSSSSNYKSNNDSGNSILEIIDIDTFYESKINPLSNNAGEIMTPIDINGLQCPKVFKADLVTVNLPAKDVLGQKYANFAKNLAENHRNEKNVQNTFRNNQMMNSSLTSLPPMSTSTSTTPRSAGSAMSNFIQNSNGSGINGSNEYLTKVNNTSFLANDRYPKPGSYGGLQIFPMNGINYEINGQPQQQHQQHQQQHQQLSENERLEDMLKICTEYADRQHQQQQQQQQSTQQNSINSSPIVQNRIKTNGSLPREKKSPFYAADGNTPNVVNQQQNQQRSTINTSNATTTTTTANSSGYENVRLLTQNRVEITEQQQLNKNNNNNHHQHNNNSNNNSMTITTTATAASNQRTNGYENVVVGKYVPQSPRTKIRTTCMSPKKEHNFNGSPFSTNNNAIGNPIATTSNSHTNSLVKQQEYAQLIKTFERKLQLEMQAIEESSRYKPPVPPLKPSNNTTKSATNTPIKRLNKNINNLSLNIQQQQQRQAQMQESCSLQNSPKPCRKPAPAPRSVLLQQEKIPQNTYSSDSLDIDIEKLKETRKTLLRDQQSLKRDINELQQHEGEALRELNMEKALVLAEVTNLTETLAYYDQQLHELKTKIHRLEAQRNATRVMEETQQAKLKQSIEIKQEQVQKLKELLLQKPNNECLKEELHNVSDSLENDRKTFEDLEFQYLEEESEWHAYREELHLEETDLSKLLTDKQQQLQQLRNEEGKNQCSASTDAKQLQNNMQQLLQELQNCEKNLHATESKLSDVNGNNNNNNKNNNSENCEEEEKEEEKSAIDISGHLLNGGGMMSQSLFGSAEILCAKHIGNDIMSKSVNENMFYNNSIEAPMGNATSTPKRAAMKIMHIEHDNVNDNDDENWSPSERIKFNLSLGSDDFEVNPLEKRVPSQDDIDRICKVTSDAPISTKGASTKIFDSIKEIERNRQLLLAQQGHHVIEHERQKMFDLKKRCHDEARAQYLSQSSVNSDQASNTQQKQQQEHGSCENEEELQKLNAKSAEISLVSGKNQLSENIESSTNKAQTTTTTEPALTNNDTQRHSQPEFQADEERANSHLLLPPNANKNPRPLSATNSDLSCDILQTCNNNQLSYIQNCAANKSSLELNALALRQAAVLQRFSTERALRQKEQEDEAELEAERKRSSLNSTETTSAGSSGVGGGGNGNGGSSSASGSSGSSAYVERKRTVLPKHQRPLTRYLPIFSPDLNLRHHIETAGHQIALCPHVFIDAFSCRGYLHKLGATFHTWARRWFVLDRQRSAFIYYADKSERKPRGGAYFSTIDEVYLDHLNASKSGRPHCTFIVKTKKRSYHLQAASDAAARIWIDAIITGAQGNIDY